MQFLFCGGMTTSTGFLNWGGGSEAGESWFLRNVPGDSGRVLISLCLTVLTAETFLFNSAEQVWKASLVYPKANQNQVSIWDSENIGSRGERCDVWFSSHRECQLFRSRLFNLQSDVFLYLAPKRLWEGRTPPRLVFTFCSSPGANLDSLSACLK